MRLYHASVTVLLLSSMLLGCSDDDYILTSKDLARAKPHRDRIEKALLTLHTRINDDGFVIFSEAGSEKFVQFMGGGGEPLLLDLPRQTLSNTEFSRAGAFFRELGIEGPDVRQLKPIGEGEPFTQISFNMEFQDPKRAADVAIRIFLRVYRFDPEFELVLQEEYDG